MVRALRRLSVLFLLLALTTWDARGQEPSAPPTATPGWTSRCVSETRGGAADCAIEQRLVVQSGQALVTVTVRVPAEPREPALRVQTPLGLYLPAGLQLRVDAGEVVPLELQGCDANGCYAGLAVSKTFLGALSDGQTLRLTLETMAREPVAVDVPLAGFARAYAGIR